MKRVEGDVLGKVGEVRVVGRWPAGRPRKKWSDCVMGDMNFVESGGACDAGLMDVEGSHRPSNPIQKWGH